MKYDLKKYRDKATYGDTGDSATDEIDNADAFWWMKWEANADENWKVAKEGHWIDKTLYGSRPGGWVFVCGSGPSLRKHTDELAHVHQNGGYIIAVDSAYRVLRENDIFPELVICADGQPEVAGMLDGIDRRSRVAINITCHPDVYKAAHKAGCKIDWWGPLNPYSRFCRFLETKYGEGICTTFVGATVMVPAISAAVFMGFNRVVTVGNDCCWYSAEEAAADGHDVTLPPDEQGRHFIGAFLASADAHSVFPYLFPQIDFADCSGGLEKAGWRQTKISLKPIYADDGVKK